VGDITSTLPAGVRGPFFNDEYSDVYSAVLALTGADNPSWSARPSRSASACCASPASRRSPIGARSSSGIFVEVSHARLATLGIAPRGARALSRQNPVAPAGVVETGATRVHLRVTGALDGLAAIREVPVSGPEGRTIRLGDIAEVSRGVADPPSAAVFHRGQGAVTISVAKQRGYNVLSLGEALEAELAAIRAELPVGLALELVSDQPRIVAESVGEFLQKFAAALGVVLLVSFLSLGLRAGIIVALSVPLTLACVFVMMAIWGTELERISLGALILALGLLVDDAIIAIETMAVKLEEGWDRLRAATFAWGSTAGPMLSGTLVTVAGFIPWASPPPPPASMRAASSGWSAPR
jgi:multidrug efflux pump subunit AcrB